MPEIKEISLHAIDDHGRHMSFPLIEVCGTCHGNREISLGMIKESCSLCFGKESANCPLCNGAGSHQVEEKKPCPECSGRGFKPHENIEAIKKSLAMIGWPPYHDPLQRIG